MFERNNHIFKWHLKLFLLFRAKENLFFYSAAEEFLTMTGGNGSLALPLLTISRPTPLGLVLLFCIRHFISTPRKVVETHLYTVTANISKLIIPSWEETWREWEGERVEWGTEDEMGNKKLQQQKRFSEKKYKFYLSSFSLTSGEGSTGKCVCRFVCHNIYITPSAEIYSLFVSDF